MNMLKKIAVLSLIVAVAAGVAVAGRGGGMGAVKTGLYARVGGEGPADPGSGDWVGFVVLNTDCEGVLSANVVAKGLDEGAYDVYVKTSGPYSGQLLGTLHVNARGNGAVQVSTDVGTAEERGETVPVQVVVKTGSAAAIVGAATATEDVSLKFPCE